VNAGIVAGEIEPWYPGDVVGVVDDALPGPLGALWPGYAKGAQRRAAADRKLLLFAEDHRPLVYALIDARLGGGLAAQYVKLFADRSPNLLLAVTSAIAVAYRSGVRRELKGASPEQAKAFADLVSESGIDRKAAGLNARSWVAGPHIVAPHFTKRGKLALDIIGPNRADIERDGDDIDAVIWKQGATFVHLDGQAWRYFDAEGVEIEGDAVYHATGVCPAVPFVSFDGGDDFWAQTAHNGLVDATLTIAYKMALGLMTRQVSGTPLTTIFAELQEAPPGQVLGHPFLPLLLPPDAKVQVDDERVVKAEDYLSEISALITMAVSAEGLPPGSVTLQAGAEWGNLTIAAEGPRLAAHRDKQVPHLKRSELDLWPLVCDLVRGSAHRHARVIPPGDEVRDMLRVNFPDLSSPKEQIERIEAMKAGLPFGISNPTDIILQAQPEVSPDEAAETRKGNLADYIADIDPLVRRNIPAAAPEARGVETIAQEQGRTGGQASGQTRAVQAQEQNP